MKKFFYVALMALTVGFFASCSEKSSIGNSDYYKNNKLVVDKDNHSVNGKVFDNTTEKCWKVTTIITASVMGVKDSETETEYVWATEYDLVVNQETAIYAASTVPFTTTTYSYEESPAKDFDACDEKNYDE